MSCSLQESGLRASYMDLQRVYHPDKYAAASSQDRLKAVQISSFLNQAHKTLSSPLKRAEYCLHLQGGSSDSESDATMDSMFLMEQMEWRETLDDIKSGSDESFKVLDELRAEIKQRTNQIEVQTAQFLEAQDVEQARDTLRKWQFLVKLIAETDAVEAQLDEQS